MHRASAGVPHAAERGRMPEAAPIIDLFKRRHDLKCKIAGVELAIERCQHNWQDVPKSEFEDRDGAEARVSGRTCAR
jgi:hypothetical protein